MSGLGPFPLWQLEIQTLVGPGRGWGWVALTHSYTHGSSRPLWAGGRVVLARLLGSSLTPFEPMSQNNSRRFQGYRQRFSSPRFSQNPPLSRLGSVSETSPSNDFALLHTKTQTAAGGPRQTRRTVTTRREAFLQPLNPPSRRRPGGAKREFEETLTSEV